MAIMAQRLLFGGCGSSESWIKIVTGKLSEHYGDEVTGIRLEPALSRPDQFAPLIEGAIVDTSSFGFAALLRVMELTDCLPKEIRAVAPPLLPTSRRKLAGRAINALRQDDEPKSPDAAMYSKAFKYELAAHPVRNMRNFADAAGIDALGGAIRAREAGVEVGLVCMTGDKIYPLGDVERTMAQEAGLHLVELQGPHEGFTYDPVGIMTKFEETKRPTLVA